MSTATQPGGANIWNGRRGETAAVWFYHHRPSGPLWRVASQRTSVAPSAWSFGGNGKDGDHADGTPAACYW